MDNNKLFISFSSKNSEEANRVCDFLEANGYPCFISSRDLIAGKEYAGQLIDNITASKAVVLLLSKASNESPHVLREVEYAVSKNIPIIVYTLEEVKLSKSMEYYLMTHQWIPATANRDERLLKGVKHIVDGTVDESEFKEPSDYVLADKKRNTKLIIIIAFFILVLALGICIKIIFSKAGKDNPGNDDNSSPSPGITETVNEPKPTKEVTPTEEVTPDATPGAPVESNYKLGDTITLGSYLDQAIDWRVIKINEDGSLVLLAKNILSMKIFDAAEGGEYNMVNGVNYFSYAYHIIEDPNLCVAARGNNDWSLSNLRTWLNSDAELVKYDDQAPTRKTWLYNYYDAEPGFLNGFTDAEKEALVPTKNLTKANSLSLNAKNGKVETTDLVYLLTSDDLVLLDEAGISYYGFPTDACVEKDNNPEGYAYLKNELKINSYYWWLRDNPDTYPNRVNAVSSEYESDTLIIDTSAGASTYGVRPAITVDPSKLK